MKISLVTAFSIVGVLATGGAALAATTTVRDPVIPSAVTTRKPAPPVTKSKLTPKATIKKLATTVTSTTLAPVVTTTTTLAPVVTTTTTLAPVVTTTTLAPVVTTTTLAPGSTQFDYNISGVGIVTLKQNATSIEVVSVKLVSGWTYETENKGTTRVEIEFANGTKEVEFRARLVDGRIVTEVKVDDDEADEVDEADDDDDDDDDHDDDSDDDDDDDEADDDEGDDD